MTRARLVAANWKMNGSRADNERWLRSFRAAAPACAVVVCPPFVYLPQVAQALAGSAAQAGAQDVRRDAHGKTRSPMRTVL